MIKPSRNIFMKNHPRRHHSQGFTLTELLVVILIIAVLAALSMMGSSRIRSMADKVAATRSLSSLQLANVNYASDHNGNYLPNLVNDDKGALAARWFQVTEYLDYFRGELPEKNGNPSLEIPESSLDPKVVRDKKLAWDKIYSSFGQNVNGLPSTTSLPNGVKQYTTNTVGKPERSMSFATATDFRVAYPARLTWFSREPAEREGKTADGGMAYRHGNKALVVYFDGHVAEISEGDMKTFDKQGGSKSPFWLPIQE